MPLYDELFSVLSDSEWKEAASSTLSAYYTPREIIRGMWDIAVRAGFRGGVTAELGAGIGYFPGLQPDDSIRGRTKWHVVEKDAVSAAILEKLYPQADVYHNSLENVKLPVNSMDLVIGNVPFSQTGVYDPDYPNFNLHNYFLAKGIDSLRPGGMSICLTSSYTMDSPSSHGTRKYLSIKADLVTAIRLPQNTFVETADTEVTTDILVFRRKDGTDFRGHDFVNLVNTKIENASGELTEYRINRFFADNPQNMLGTMKLSGTSYRGCEPVLEPVDGQDMIIALENVITRSVPVDIMRYNRQVKPLFKYNPEIFLSKKNFSYFTDDNGNIAQVVNGQIISCEFSGNMTRKDRALAFTDLKDHIKNHFILMRTSLSDDDPGIEKSRLKLNEKYDSIVKKYGFLNNARKYGYLADDPEYSLVLSIENVIKQKKLSNGILKFVRTYEKAEVFYKRTLYPYKIPETAENLHDALTISFNVSNEINLPYIAGLVNMSQNECRVQLLNNRLIFENPETGLLEKRNVYLSGNVRKKLAAAGKAAKTDRKFINNVEELEKIIPKWIELKDIQANIGSVWIPEKVFEQFLQDTLDIRCAVLFSEEAGTWKVNLRSSSSAKNRNTFGTGDFSAHELFEKELNMKSPAVFDTVNTGIDNKVKRVLNPEKTALAKSKVTELKSEFREWFYNVAAGKFKSELELEYNNRFNSIVPCKFEPHFWKWYPGMARNERMVPREHQKKVVSRILTESTLLAHAVGTGKTLIMCAAAMEMKRTGISRKPMIVVQNSTHEQFTQAFRKLYPDANILSPGRKQRSAKVRNKLISSIMSNDHDAVIIPQSFFNLLPVDPEREKRMTEEQISELTSIIYQKKYDEGSRSFSVREVQRQINALEKRLNALKDTKKDNTVYFEDLGIDALFIDEAHAYKKFPFVTKIENIKGLDKDSGKQALAAMMKIRHVQEKTGGKNVVLATGTPITNTLTECWNIIRAVRPDILKEYNCRTFDSFASTFAERSVSLEQTSGGTWKSVERFAKYKNVPELIKFFRTGADVVLTGETGIKLPAHHQGKPVSIAVEQSEHLQNIISGIRTELEMFDRLSGKEKKENSHIPLNCYTRGRKASIDVRLVNPDLKINPEEDSKIKQLCGNLKREYNLTRGIKGTQLVFSDLYQSGDKSFNVFHEIKKELTVNGIPAEHIALPAECGSDEQRESLFERVQSGDVSVLLGTTAKMGVGVNVQNRCTAIHHLDAPFMPSDMEQRNGRAFRQGNINTEVKEFRYGTVNTLDAAIYQLLVIKDSMIRQVMSGEINERVITDGPGEISYDEQMAIYSGEPLAIEKVTLQNEFKNLSMLRRSHERNMRESLIMKGKLETALYSDRNRFEQFREHKNTFRTRFPDRKPEGGKIGGQYFDKDRFSKEFKNVFTAAVENVKTDYADRNGETFTRDMPEIEILGQKLETELVVPFDIMNNFLDRENVAIDYSGKFNDFFNFKGTFKTASGFMNSFNNCIKKYELEHTDLKNRIQCAERDISELDRTSRKQFEKEDRYQAVKTRIEEIERILESKSRELSDKKESNEAESENTAAGKSRR